MLSFHRQSLNLHYLLSSRLQQVPSLSVNFTSACFEYAVHLFSLQWRLRKNTEHIRKSIFSIGGEENPLAPMLDQAVKYPLLNSTLNISSYFSWNSFMFSCFSSPRYFNLKAFCTSRDYIKVTFHRIEPVESFDKI